MSTPRAVQQVRGVSGKRLKAGGSQALLPVTLKAPDFMDKYAQEAWVEVAKVQQSLSDTGAVWITVADAHALELYCMAYSAWRVQLEALQRSKEEMRRQVYATHRAAGRSEEEAQEAADGVTGTMVKIDTGQMLASPFVVMERQARKACLEAATALRLTPAARAKLEIIALDAGDKSGASRLLA